MKYNLYILCFTLLATVGITSLHPNHSDEENALRKRYAVKIAGHLYTRRSVEIAPLLAESVWFCRRQLVERWASRCGEPRQQQWVK